MTEVVYQYNHPTGCDRAMTGRSSRQEHQEMNEKTEIPVVKD